MRSWSNRTTPSWTRHRSATGEAWEQAGASPSVVGDLTGGGSTKATDQTTTASDLVSRCRRGADANRDEDCRIVGIANSVQAWKSAQNGRPAGCNTFTDRI